MRFSWDEAKRRRNLAKHRLDFADAARLTWPLAHLAEVQYVDGEERDVSYVPLDGRILTVVYVVLDDRHYRIISLRGATREEENEFYRRRT